MLPALLPALAAAAAAGGDQQVGLQQRRCLRLQQPLLLQLVGVNAVSCGLVLLLPALRAAAAAAALALPFLLLLEPTATGCSAA